MQNGGGSGSAAAAAERTSGGERTSAGGASAVEGGSSAVLDEDEDDEDDGEEGEEGDGEEDDEDDGEEDDDEDDDAYADHRLSYEGHHYGLSPHHGYHHSLPPLHPHHLDPQSHYGAGSHHSLDPNTLQLPPGTEGMDLGGELPVAPEVHSELMEAVMQQWLHTPAGQSAAQEAARLELSSEEVGQFFHARMLQSLGRLRIGPGGGAVAGAEGGPSVEQMRLAVGNLPEEDEAAVTRLESLGFAREQAAEAYLACERNEMLAANFLMDTL